jgi:hypothetical protein
MNTRRPALTSLLLAAASVAVGYPRAAAEDPKTMLDQLAFMTGSWTMKTRTGFMEEHWTSPAGGSLVGMMRQVANGKTVMRELETVEETPEGILLRVKHFDAKMEEIVSKTLVRKLASVKHGEAVFEGVGPEAGRKIVYRLEKDGRLFVQVDVVREGKVVPLTFTMERMGRP